MDSPLVMREYFFPVAQVVAEPNFSEDGDVNDISYDISVGLKEVKDLKYQLAVEISSLKPEIGEENHTSYNINLVALGIFEVSPKCPEPEKLVKINGASILYSAAREFLITITSRGPWGALTLPTVSFLSKYKKESEEVEDN